MMGGRPGQDRGRDYRAARPVGVPIISGQTLWHCPLCGMEDMTTEARPHTQMHPCRATGLTTPMLMQGRRSELRFVERQDYIGDERVQYDRNKRPIMAAVVEREDGNDVAVYAPTATADGRSHGA